MGASARAGGGRRGNCWRAIGWGGAALLLLVPLVVQAPWTLADFVFMGALLGGVGFGCELAIRRGNAAYATAAGVALASAFLLAWIDAAVGIIDSEQDDVYALFLGVVAVALLGAVGARFRPAGMARAMTATAIAQIAVPVVAWIAGLGSAASLVAPEVPILTGFFAAMWLGSAWLFRQAG